MFDVINKVSEVAHRILRRKLSYQDCFHDSTGNLSVSATYLLKDLAKFCNVNRPSMLQPTVGNVDALVMAFNEGKRAVYNKIIKSLNIDDAQIYKMYKDLDNE